MKIEREGSLPFDDEADAIARLLEDLHPAALLMSLVHLTGDASLLTGPFRPRSAGLFDDEGGLDADERAALRSVAVAALLAYRTRGYELPPPPSADLALDMMRTLVCQPVGEEYRPWIRDELRLDGVDPGEIPLRSSPEGRARLPVVVIGCGESGLLAGIRLKEAGIPFTILEKNDGVGGTWLENRYPGCRVDIPNHFYSYSFETNDGWTRFFSEQPEIRAYLERVMARHDIAPHVRWRTEVRSCVWQPDSATWRIHVRTPDGADEELVARAVISAVGQLNRPLVPAIAGADSFAGPTFHTAAWDDTVDLRGARVAVLGAGASGFQLVPTIAPDVAQLTVYQRTAQWIAPSPRYHERVGPGVGWAVRHVPFYARWYRLSLAWQVCDGAMQFSRRDPDWDGGDRSVSAVNEMVRAGFTAWIEAQVEDPELLAKVIPDYPPFGKRMLQDNGTWLRALQRDNVELVRDAIDHIDATGVTTVDGRHRPADVLIYATGFKVSEVLWPMRIVGTGGAVLDEVWNGKPSAYLGITIPGFPNFFCMYGPGTNQVHGGSILFVSECQMTYILGCLDLLARDDSAVLECRRDVHDDYHARSQAELANTVWTHPAVRSYYKHADGNVYTVLPWRSIDYWHWTRAPREADFVWSSAAARVAAAR